MIEIGECLYVAPRIGDVALMTTRWRDDAAPETVYHTVVPVVGGVAWWSWCADSPPFVQTTLHQVFTEVARLRDAGEDTDASLGY